jgi:sarcosine oxidase
MGERSAGSSRIFRLAHADADLVRLAMRAREGFAAWARRAGRPMVDRRGCVVSGGDAADRAAAMERAGAACELVEPGDARLRLPVTAAARERIGGPVLVDPEGGVVDVDAVRALLRAEAGPAVVPEPVQGLDADPDRAAGARVRTAGGTHRFDAVVLAAGAGTPALAARVGIAVPAALVHHARFTFPFAEAPPSDAADGGAASWPSWIDAPGDGLATYQHRSGPGRWAVGGTVDPALVAWEVGREAAVAASREVVLAHVRERLAVRPEVVETLYCHHTPDTGDGVTFRRAGPVVAVHGENLMKFAPVLGQDLAAAVLDGSTPRTAGTPEVHHPAR